MSTTPDPRALLDALDEVHAAAWSEVGGLCDGSRRWTMRVPVDSSRDSDEVIGAALTAGEKAAAAVRAALAEHRPMVNNGAGVPACPECLGGIFLDDPLGARSCGCWGLSTPVCSSCAGPVIAGRRFALEWPCPTYATVTAALTGGGR